LQTSGAPRREIANVRLTVIARSEATKQSTLTFFLASAFFLLLDGLLRFARNDGRSNGFASRSLSSGRCVAAIRWLAMTVAE
jgi:hypothetical protein